MSRASDFASAHLNPTLLLARPSPPLSAAHFALKPTKLDPDDHHHVKERSKMDPVGTPLGGTVPLAPLAARDDIEVLCLGGGIVGASLAAALGQVQHRPSDAPSSLLQHTSRAPRRAPPLDRPDANRVDRSPALSRTAGALSLSSATFVFRRRSSASCCSLRAATRCASSAWQTVSRVSGSDDRAPRCAPWGPKGARVGRI